MHEAFDITTQSRKVLENYLQNYSLEQLNKVPQGFNNNLIWNISHIIVVQQLLVYKLSGLPTMVSDEMIAKYQKGTKPESDVTQKEADEIKALLFETINQTKADFDNQIFKNYHQFTNNQGFAIRNDEGAIAYNNYHEAMHLGMMMSIKKFL